MISGILNFILQQTAMAHRNENNTISQNPSECVSVY
jgi:hypothetical protein